MIQIFYDSPPVRYFFEAPKTKLLQVQALLPGKPLSKLFDLRVLLFQLRNPHFPKRKALRKKRLGSK